MEYSVKTFTGKEFEIRFMGATVVGVTSVLYIEFIGYGMMDLVPIFADKHETQMIYGLEKGEVKKEYKDYVNLIETIVLAESGNIRIALTANMDSFGDF